MIEYAELERLERDVADALARADASALRVLGYGEISLVLGSPADAPRWACKRLPPFPSTESADRYVSVLDRYVRELGERGVTVVETVVERIPLDGGRVALYCIQPVVPPESLGPAIVARGDSDAARSLLHDIIDVIVAVVDDRVGVDAQLSNWAVCDGRLMYFDVTSPMLRTAEGFSELDAEVFLASLPWPLRTPVRRLLLPGILERYHVARAVVLDLAANLIKERLESWIPVVLDAANGRIEPPITEAEVRRDYRSDARTWNLLQAARRVDRTWQRRIRRCPYPVLLPERIER